MVPLRFGGPTAARATATPGDCNRFGDGCGGLGPGGAPHPIPAGTAAIRFAQLIITKYSTNGNKAPLVTPALNTNSGYLLVNNDPANEVSSKGMKKKEKRL